VGTFGKPPRENNLNHESSSLLIRRLKKCTSFTLQRFTQRNSMKKLTLMTHQPPQRFTHTTQTRFFNRGLGTQDTDQHRALGDGCADQCWALTEEAPTMKTCSSRSWPPKWDAPWQKTNPARPKPGGGIWNQAAAKTGRASTGGGGAWTARVELDLENQRGSTPVKTDEEPIPEMD
jgi:hypothetical protein